MVATTGARARERRATGTVAEIEDHLEPMREEKRCPDCAELVLAQARVCRYCGYRFASVPATRALEWIRRPPDTKPLPALLLEWGIELSEDEDVAFFGLCAVDSTGGFLLVTNRRLVFFAQRGPRKLLDWPVEAVRDVEVRGRRRRASLCLSGELGRVTLRQFASESVLRRVADELQATRLPQQPSSLGERGPGSD